MEIVSLKISGFDRYSPEYTIQFKDQLGFRKGGEISGQDAFYLFRIITGIIFGLTAEEKKKYRSSDGSSNVFTGMVTLELENQSLLIERDFETDIIACIYVGQDNSKPLFHGKDNPDSEQKRPFMDVISKFFFITNRDNLEKICAASYNPDKDSFNKLLYLLNIIITCKFKFNSAKNLLNDAGQLDIFHQRSITRLSLLESKMAKKEAIEYLIQLKRTADQFEGDIQTLNTIINNYQEKLPAYGTEYAHLQKKYPHLANMNPIQFRDEVLFWKNLREIKFVSEDNLYQIRQRINDIEDMFKNELAVYKNTQPGFEKAAEHYQYLHKELAEKKQKLSDTRAHVTKLENLLIDYKKTKRILLITLTPIVFIITLLIFGLYWIMVIPVSLMVAAIVFSVYGHRNFKIRSQIFRIEEETHVLQKVIRDIEIEMKKMSINNTLLDDIDLLDSHVDRYKKYINITSELRLLEKEEVRLRKLLESRPYKEKIPEFIDKYAAVIDVDRDDIEEYMERIVIEHEHSIKSGSQNTISSNNQDDIHLMLKNYRTIQVELKKMYSRIIDNIHIDHDESNLNEMLEKISTEIKTQILETNLN